MTIATVDQRVKTLIGDLVVQLQASNMKVEELQEELARFKPKEPEGNGVGRGPKGPAIVAERQQAIADI